MKPQFRIYFQRNKSYRTITIAQQVNDQQKLFNDLKPLALLKQSKRYTRMKSFQVFAVIWYFVHDKRKNIYRPTHTKNKRITQN